MNLEKAIKIAVEAHTGQVDKGGNPYILHPLRVMLSLNSEQERIVGVLHDVVEDCAPEDYMWDREDFSHYQQLSKEQKAWTNLDYFSFPHCLERRSSLEKAPLF